MDFVARTRPRPLRRLATFHWENTVMRRYLGFITGCGLLAIGYLLGASGIASPGFLLAQADEAAGGPSEENQAKIKAADDALKAAAAGLMDEYKPATRGFNAFAVTVGGIDCIQDLESGRGVDPETFAALYADRAIDEVKPHLTRDPDNRLLYKNKLVRMYSVSRLKQAWARRAALAGEKEEVPESGTGKKKPATKPAESEEQ
jgi:hypothetical protein